MKEIEIDTGSLLGQLDKFDQETDEITLIVNQLIQTVEELNPMWEGQAHEAFYGEFVSDHEELEEFIKTLIRIKEQFHTARLKYESCENEVGNIVSSIKS